MEVIATEPGLNSRTLAASARIIAAEPELSNNEIAARAGIKEKGSASELLTRLARFELPVPERVIESLVRDPLRFGANAWRLTPSGSELATAIRDDTRRVN